jgi:hypothetical protein
MYLREIAMFHQLHLQSSIEIGMQNLEVQVQSRYGSRYGTIVAIRYVALQRSYDKNNEEEK